MKHLLTYVPDPLLMACAECRIGVRSLPYLGDHAFQEMVVLPGSFYIEMALSVHQECLGRAPGVVRNVTFRNPVVLSLDDSIIRVEVRNNGGATAEYTFYEGAVENGSAPSPSQFLVRLEIDRSPSALQESVNEPFSIEEFQAQAHDVIDSQRFYRKLRDNGNQYGPRFQCVSSIWRADNQSLGRLSWRRAGSEPHCVHPALLDSMTQMLAPFMMAEGRTFILRSIERIEIADLNFPDTFWCYATRLPETEGENKGVVGNIRVFGTLGKRYLELSGVVFTLLDDARALEKDTASSMVVACNFTAEPLEDSLKFWAAHFGLQTNIEFAPYDQIFQQLLQVESAFRRNRDGVNIILLQLEKWAAAERDCAVALDRQKAEHCFGRRRRCVLPNGLEIVHLHQYETDYLYKEIFENRCYLKHGVRLPDGATVVDIGANIGLFSLFVMSRCRNPRIYAFEPAPVAYDVLKANCDAYGASAKIFNFGVSDRPGIATFTCYENSSVFSSFHSSEAEDREAIQAVVRNVLNAAVAEELLQEDVNELTNDRLRRSTHECRLTSISDIIRDNQIDRIDLLKIDAEKSELNIIRGIEDCDWSKIDQIVIEIHDPTGEAVRWMSNLLSEKGYRCAVEQEELLENSGLFNLFATRDETHDRVGSDSEHFHTAAPPAPMQLLPGHLQRNVRDFGAALLSFTNQTSMPLILCFCPASPAVEANVELKASLADAERELVSRSSAMASVSTISSKFLSLNYPVAEYYDVHGYDLGDIPYTTECYAAIGTALFRTIFGLKGKPFKVIVLDCDNTLWKGVCGEDGPGGIAVTEPYRALQQFMLGQMNAGMLLCLCSKNSEKDVLDVLDHRADMLLKREHLTSWRINWNNKSENIQSLARELNLGLDSFIFVDDNPVECADVEINCPGVLTLKVPRDSSSFSSFFENIWAFDHMGTTVEDRTRTRMYQENAKRESFRAQAPSLNDFVASLMVRVEMAEPTEDQLSRISQLTFRTNQFNFTTIRRSESEVRDWLRRENAGCLVVRVSDRFGDYGLVGLVVYETGTDRLKLDTFLLSCRVLGRGVEHTVLSGIGFRALSLGKRFVELTYLPTERNLPAKEFVSSLGDQYRSQRGDSWLFPAEYLADLQYHPDEKTRQRNDKVATGPADKPGPPSAFGFGIARSEHFQRIGDELHDVNRVARAISEFQLQARALDDVTKTAPSAGLETAILNIWRKVLARPGIGLDVNFFEAGGTSLKAVQTIATIRKELKHNLSITSLFESPTVRLLAARLSPIPGSPSSEPTASEAALRGRQRRLRAIRRTQ